MHILVTGNFVQGFSFTGPFPDSDTACDYVARTHDGGDWWVSPIETPNSGGYIPTPKAMAIIVKAQQDIITELCSILDAIDQIRNNGSFTEARFAELGSLDTFVDRYRKFIAEA
jgi:hypothetical protein